MCSAPTARRPSCSAGRSRTSRGRRSTTSSPSTIVSAAGNERVVAVSTTPLMVDGELLGTVATLRDVTEEKQAQDTLARSEARYRNLFESASDAIATFD